MKKLFVAFFVLLLASGCGVKHDSLSCKSTTNSNGITTTTHYDIDYMDNDVKMIKITYDYKQDTITDTDNDGKDDIDGVGTGTDGTTNDTQKDNDGIVDGIVGSAIDTIIGGVTDTILDIAGLKERHATVQNRYGNIQGFSVQNTTDTDNNYKVTYVIDYDAITDTDLNTLNLSRDIDTLRDNYTTQGYTCSK